MFKKQTSSDNSVDLEGSDLLYATLSYLRYLGSEADKAVLLSGLPIDSESLPEDYLRRAVELQRFTLIWMKERRLKSAVLPCCAKLKDGKFFVVVGMVGDEYQVLSEGTSSVVHRISAKAFQLLYAGKFFRLRPMIELLQEKHEVPITKGHWFWSRVFFRKFRVLDIVLASLFANLLAVTVSLFALQVYDRVIPGQSEATLWVLVGGAAIAILFEAAIRISRSTLIDQTGKEAELVITQELFSKLLGMRLDSRPAQPGSLVHMIREFAAVREFFTTASVGVVADLPFVLIFVLLTFGIAGHIVWIIVIGALLTILPSLIFQSKMARLSKEALGGMSAASRLLSEAAYNLENLKLAQASPQFQRKWEEITILNVVKTTEQRELSAFLTFWASAVQQCTYVSAVVAGVYMVFAGEFTVGSIIAVSILTTRTLSPITQLSTVLSRWQNMKASLDALETIVTSIQEREPDRTYIRKSLMSGKIELANVKFIHPGLNYPSLKVNALTLERGTKLAILGENGSGKSTLLRVLSGLYYPSEGEMTIDELDVRQVDPLDIRNNIGLLSQDLALNSGTIRENLYQGSRNFADEELLGALDFSGLGTFVRQHARGLDLEIFDGGVGLSVGQRQSLGLARLYLQNPKVVLLDEPTSALDQSLEQDIISKLGEWLNDKTCVIATHRMSILSIVDRIAVMQGGQLVMEGPRDNVLKRLTTPSAMQSK